jgi:hypothetical protein
MRPGVVPDGVQMNVAYATSVRTAWGGEVTTRQQGDVAGPESARPAGWVREVENARELE